MKDFVLVNVGDGRSVHYTTGEILPNGCTIIGVQMGGQAIQLHDQSEVFFKTGGFGSWVVCPARLVYYNVVSGNLRLGESGDYEPKQSEYPVAVVYHFDFTGSQLDFAMIERNLAQALVILKFLMDEIPSLETVLMRKVVSVTLAFK